MIYPPASANNLVNRSGQTRNTAKEKQKIILKKYIHLFHSVEAFKSHSLELDEKIHTPLIRNSYYRTGIVGCAGRLADASVFDELGMRINNQLFLQVQPLK